jgi:hypothetical protein
MWDDAGTRREMMELVGSPGGWASSRAHARRCPLPPVRYLPTPPGRLARSKCTWRFTRCADRWSAGPSAGLLGGSDQLLPWLLLVVVRHMPILAKLATHLIAVLSNDYAVCLLPVAFNNSRPLVASVVRVLLVASWVHMEMEATS